ncbi:MAG: hypothetical protein K0U98_06655 [Deltaproteobacteria bacterium]|nr:hypothetical protein [Deltaproteobacteria bacterium]
MKHVPIGLSLLLVLALSVALWPGESDAASIANVTLDSFFTGCSGNVASYDLEANKDVVGGAFSWSHGVTPLSANTADPNFATTSFVKFEKRVTVSFWHPIGIWDSAQVTLPNPCI